MGKLAVYKYISFMMLVITIMIAVFTLFGLFGGSSNPGEGTALALLVYALPLLMIFNFALLVLWLIRRRWYWAVIPAVTLLCCIPFLGTIYQLPLLSGEDNSKMGFKMATYNVAMFGRELNGAKADAILSTMRQQQVEVLCLQEYMERSGDTINSSRYKGYFTDMVCGREDMAIFSRHPILDSKTIEFGEMTNNSAMWADIDFNGRVIRFFNVHLQTTGINRTLHQQAKQEAQGIPAERGSLMRALFGNFTHGMSERSRQAELVANEIKQSKFPVVVCGDFNDVPYSYVYNTMKGDLIDGFRECGRGFMYTMEGKYKKVRIDYIFHSEELEGAKYYVEKEIHYSDHLPVFMKIAL